jgi:hypothetical protein
MSAQRSSLLQSRTFRASAAGVLLQIALLAIWDNTHAFLFGYDVMTPAVVFVVPILFGYCFGPWPGVATGALGTGLYRLFLFIRLVQQGNDWFELISVSTVLVLILCGVAGFGAGAIRQYTSRKSPFLRVAAGFALAASVIALQMCLTIALGDLWDYITYFAAYGVIFLVLVLVLLVLVEVGLFRWFWPGGRLAFMAFIRKLLIATAVIELLALLVAVLFVWQERSWWRDEPYIYLLTGLVSAAILFLLAEGLHWMLQVEGHLHYANVLTEGRTLSSVQSSPQTPSVRSGEVQSTHTP